VDVRRLLIRGVITTVGPALVVGDKVSAVVLDISHFKIKTRCWHSEIDVVLASEG